MDELPGLALTISGACKHAGIGRTTLYALIAEGRIAARKCGSKTLVLTDSLRAYLDTLPPAGIGAKRRATAEAPR